MDFVMHVQRLCQDVRSAVFQILDDEQKRNFHLIVNDLYGATLLARHGICAEGYMDKTEEPQLSAVGQAVISAFTANKLKLSTPLAHYINDQTTELVNSLSSVEPR